MSTFDSLFPLSFPELYESRTERSQLRAQSAAQRPRDRDQPLNAAMALDPVRLTALGKFAGYLPSQPLRSAGPFQFTALVVEVPCSAPTLIRPSVVVCQQV